MMDLNKIIVQDVLEPGYMDMVELKLGRRVIQLYRAEFNDLLAKMLAYDAASPVPFIKPKEK